MKCRVIKGFIDKYNGTAYSVDDEISVSNKRFEEIQAKGSFLQPVAVSKPKKEDAVTEETAE